MDAGNAVRRALRLVLAEAESSEPEGVTPEEARRQALQRNEWMRDAQGIFNVAACDRCALALRAERPDDGVSLGIANEATRVVADRERQRLGGIDRAA